MAAGGGTRPGDLEDLLGREEGGRQMGRGLGKGAVTALIAAQHGEGDEDLRREGDVPIHAPSLPVRLQACLVIVAHLNVQQISGPKSGM